MSNFLFVQAAEGQSIPHWSIRLLFERHVDEQAVLLDQLRAYPSMAKVVRENPTREYMLGRRSSYWRTRLSSMVSFPSPRPAPPAPLTLHPRRWGAPSGRAGPRGWDCWARSSW